MTDPKVSTHPIASLSDIELINLLSSVYSDDLSRDLTGKYLSGTEIKRIEATLLCIPPDERKSLHLVDFAPSDVWLKAYDYLGYSQFTGLTKLPPEQSNLLSQPEKLSLEEMKARICYLDIDLEQSDLPDASVDIVCCFEILEHLALDPMAMIEEANRILKVGGLLVLSTPNIASWLSVAKAIIGLNPNNWSPYSPIPEHSAVRHHREYTVSEVNQLLIDGGFQVSEIKTMDFQEMSSFRRLLSLLIRISLSPFRGGMK